MGVEVPRDWPGLVAERDGVNYSPETIGNIAEALFEVLKPISAMSGGNRLGSVTDLSMKASLDQVRDQLRTVERWDGGRHFGDALVNSHQKVIEIYQEIVQDFTAAVVLVNDGAGRYKRADIANLGLTLGGV